MYFLYDIVMAVALVFLVPVYLYRALVKKKVRRGIRERLGFISADKIASVAGARVIWVHAVSVGETMAARPLLKGLRQAYPDWKIVLSHVTETGREVAQRIPDADLCLYFPFDCSFAVRRALRAVHPSLVVVVETEIWPRFFREARKGGAAVVIANGRISDRSFPRYRRFRRLLAPVLADVAAFCAQSRVDGERLTAMGAPRDAVHVVGNLKYDVPVAVAEPDRLQMLRERFRMAPDVPVVVAASTHAGEEALILGVSRGLETEGFRFMLVLVPRHPERAGEAAEAARAAGFDPVRRSQLTPQTPLLGPGGLLLVDTIGELMNIYPVADFVVMGGSIAPVGGHNILEPASVGKPCLFGPHMHNFRDIAGLALAKNAGWQIQNETELRETMAELLGNAATREAAGNAAATMIAENSGATERHLATIAAVLVARR